MLYAVMAPCSQLNWLFVPATPLLWTAVVQLQRGTVAYTEVSPLMK